MHVLSFKYSKKDFVVVVILCAICIGILPAIAFYPFHTDIDIQQMMGFQLYRYHALPYLGTWDENFPGTIYIHAFAMALFGVSELSLRLLDILFQAGVVVVLYKLGRLWMDRAPSLLGSAFYAIYYIHGPGQYMSQRDCFAVFPIVLTIYTTVRTFRASANSRKTFWIILSGVFAAAAFWMRPTFGILIATSMFLFANRSGYRYLLLQWVIFLCVCILVLLPYALIENGLREILLSTIRFNSDIYLHYFQIQGYSSRVWLAAALISIWAVSMLIHQWKGLRSTCQPSKKENRYLLATMAGLLLGVILMRRLASYHFAPFIACFMPILASIVWDMLQSSRILKIATVTGILVMFLALYPWKLAKAVLSNGSSQGGLSAHFDKMFNAGSDSMIVRYIEQRTLPSDSIDLISESLALWWRIDRPAATRFTTLQPLYMLAPSGLPTDYQLRWREEFLNAINCKKMKYFIIAKLPNFYPSMVEDVMDIPGFRKSLARNYYIDTTIGGYDIYAVRESKDSS